MERNLDPAESLRRDRYIMDIINMRYDYDGDLKDAIYKTPLDLRIEFRELNACTELDIRRALIGTRYLVRFINDKPHWKMFNKIKEPNEF